MISQILIHFHSLAPEKKKGVCRDLCNEYLESNLAIRFGYAPIMRWVQKIRAGQVEPKSSPSCTSFIRLCLDHQNNMRPGLCAWHKRRWSLKATLSLRNQYAPVMRRVQKIWLDQMGHWRCSQTGKMPMGVITETETEEGKDERDPKSMKLRKKVLRPPMRPIYT